MKLFYCDHCYHPLYFENTCCQRCGTMVGFLPEQNALISFKDRNKHVHSIQGVSYKECANWKYDACNWLIEHGDGEFCIACDLNRTIPDITKPTNHKAWVKFERAKHRLIYSLLRLHLPIEKKVKPEDIHGLAFDFLSPDDAVDNSPILTGHSQGLITLNIDEADSSERERIRALMGEPYRTLIGHMRHEIGHYYWECLIQNNDSILQEFRALFGDESLDYKLALENYYSQGPRNDWSFSYLSAYASSHPWEDWAETWAHYLHIMDIVETANCFGLSLSPKTRSNEAISAKDFFDPYQESDFELILKKCLPLTLAVNSLNRGMGQPDIYPFVLNPTVVQKLEFVHKLVFQVIKSHK